MIIDRAHDYSISVAALADEANAVKQLVALLEGQGQSATLPSPSASASLISPWGALRPSILNAEAQTNLNPSNALKQDAIESAVAALGTNINNVVALAGTGKKKNPVIFRQIHKILNQHQREQKIRQQTQVTINKLQNNTISDNRHSCHPPTNRVDNSSVRRFTPTHCIYMLHMHIHFTYTSTVTYPKLSLTGFGFAVGFELVTIFTSDRFDIVTVTFVFFIFCFFFFVSLFISTR